MQRARAPPPTAIRISHARPFTGVEVMPEARPGASSLVCFLRVAAALALIAALVLMLCYAIIAE